MREKIARIVLLILTGLVILPAGAYVLGGRLIGPYDGPRGIASYIGSIYADALAGQPLALALLLGPCAVAAVWWLRSRTLPRLLQSARDRTK